VHYGDVRNPWDTERVPGGSSGGSGAAVAAGLCFAATGSDTGGSIRIPAAVCGCVGLMPTYGRASLHGAVPLSWILDHPGPLTRTVRDAAIVLRAMSGRDPLDPATEDRPVPDWLDGIERGSKGLRVGVPKQHFWDKLDDEVGSLVEKAIVDLEAAGATVSEVDWPQAQAYSAACIALMLVDAAAYHAPNYPSRKDEYSPQVAAFLEFGQRITGVQVSEAMRALQVARGGEADAVLDGVDVLAVPTSPITAPTIAAAKERDLSARLGALTSLFDLTGQPVISVPCGVTAQGLPVGIQFAGRRWDEASVLRAARAYELVRGEFPAPPSQ
jgi:aspartyl-tRNA(Asn)/glutamyl-tRNA(Gln) amidotransferase subunit A